MFGLWSLVMPSKAQRPCLTPGCANLALGGYCEACATRLAGERPDGAGEMRQARRPSSAARGYGHRWRRLRRLQLARQPLCADPFGAHDGAPVLATDVDHIQARRQGGRDRMDNLQSLCHNCHSRKTARELATRRGEGGANP